MINLENCQCVVYNFGTGSCATQYEKKICFANFKIIAIASSPFCTHFHGLAKIFACRHVCVYVCVCESFFLYGFSSFSKLTSFSNSKITCEYTWQQKICSVNETFMFIGGIRGANSLGHTLYLSAKIATHKRLNKFEWLCCALNETQKKKKKKKITMFDIWLIMNVRCSKLLEISTIRNMRHLLISVPFYVHIIFFYLFRWSERKDFWVQNVAKLKIEFIGTEKCLQLSFSFTMLKYNKWCDWNYFRENNSNIEITNSDDSSFKLT